VVRRQHLAEVLTIREIADDCVYRSAMARTTSKSLVIEVVDIQGHCPVYGVGDIFHIVDGYRLVAGRPLCMHALQSLAPYYVALSRGVDPAALGLAGPDGAAYVQCLDPQEVTGGGTVVFRIGVDEQEGASV
jgi:uncharacterized repeat protein (TIGR04076 family)